MWYIYILETKTGQFYTGVTDDIQRRMQEHKDGKGARFTKIYGFNRLVYAKDFPTKHEALKREDQIQGWSRQKKFKLIRGELK